MTEDDELVVWLETANGGEGPIPAGSLDRSVFDELTEAVSDRDASQRRIDLLVSQAREQGATWALIGGALGTSRQSAHERYAHV